MALKRGGRKYIRDARGRFASSGTVSGKGHSRAAKAPANNVRKTRKRLGEGDDERSDRLHFAKERKKADKELAGLKGQLNQARQQLNVPRVAQAKLETAKTGLAKAEAKLKELEAQRVASKARREDLQRQLEASKARLRALNGANPRRRR